MHVSAWFGRDHSPPTSGVSPIRWAGGSHCRARLEVPRPNHGLTRGHTARSAPDDPENHFRNRLSILIGADHLAAVASREGLIDSRGVELEAEDPGRHD